MLSADRFLRLFVIQERVDTHLSCFYRTLELMTAVFRCSCAEDFELIIRRVVSADQSSFVRSSFETCKFKPVLVGMV